MFEQNKVDPALLDYMMPIIRAMSALEHKRKFLPAISQYHESAQEKEFKRSCLHFRETGQGDFEWAVSKKNIPGADGVVRERYQCALCGRILYDKFDQSAINILSQALEVINVYTMILPTHNVQPHVLQTFCSLKQVIPEVIKVCSETNMLINLTSQDSAVDKNIVADYNTTGNNILGSLNNF